ncbi:hypothetical protein [Streptomyces sp. NPDC001787]|uniref:hypothetical protein n=1 Tax=Streptomyces sp. NPDC001787 TaxID=3154523 RepID=UPI00331BF67A
MPHHDPLVAPEGGDTDAQDRRTKVAERAEHRRALASAIGLLALASCSSVGVGVLDVLSLLGANRAPGAYRHVLMAQLVAACLTSLWLLWAVAVRARGGQLPPVRRWFQCGAAAACGVIATVAAVPSLETGQLGPALFAVAVAWLALEVTRARRVALDLTLGTKAAPGQHRTWHVVGGTVVACVAGAVVMGVSANILRLLDAGGTVPVMAGSQLSALGIGGAGDLVLTVLRAALLEDLVVVAAGSTLLTAANRPTWQIYTTICTLEVLLHAYLGAPALAMALYAAGRLWLFRRYALVTPMMIGHAGYDLLGGLFLSLSVRYRLLITLPCLAAFLLARRITQRRAESDTPPRGDVSRTP